MIMLQILKSLDFTVTQNIIFSSNKKIHQLHSKGYFIAKNRFVTEVTFNGSFRSQDL